MSDHLDLLFEQPGDELSQLLGELRWLTLRHPVAARSAVRALVEEGKRFGATEEGSAWRERLRGSELVQRGQVLWEVGTWGSLEADDERLLPTQVIDAFSRASARRDLERAIASRVEIDGDSE